MTESAYAGRMAAALLAGAAPKGSYFVVLVCQPGERVQVTGSVPEHLLAPFLRETADSVDERLAERQGGPFG